MKKNSVMGKAAAHAPFGYVGGHPDYPQVIQGVQVRLCVAADGLTLVKRPWVEFLSEKVLLHIPREQLREVRDISHGINIGKFSEALVEVQFDLNGATHTAKFQAWGHNRVTDAVKIATATQRLIRGY